MRVCSGHANIVLTSPVICFQVDAIVNSTNNAMEMASAKASKVVAVKAGRELQAECTSFVQKRGNLPTGGIYSSRGYRLPCKHVIHVVCPNDGQVINYYCTLDYFPIANAQTSLYKGLRNAVEGCLTEANRLGVRSISFPALCTGGLGMADNVAAAAIFDGINAFVSRGPSSLRTVNIVVFDKPKLPAFQGEQTNRRMTVKPDGLLSHNDDELASDKMLSLEKGDISLDSSMSFVQEVPKKAGTVVIHVKGGDITAEDVSMCMCTRKRTCMYVCPIARARICYNLHIPCNVRQVDAIVNSTNSTMQMDSAKASKVVAAKAGKELQAECTSFVQKQGNLTTGGIYSSRGYRLSCKHVINVVCPNDGQVLSQLTASYWLL